MYYHYSHFSQNRVSVASFKSCDKFSYNTLASVVSESTELQFHIIKHIRDGPSGRSPPEVLGSNPTLVMDVCLFRVLYVVR